jgi:type I restriction enzyme M protein
MITFDRADFEKTLSTVGKKKVKIESKWEQIRLEHTLDEITGGTPKIEEYNILTEGKYPVITQDVSCQIGGYTNNNNPITDLPIILFGDHSCVVKYIDYPFFRGADGTVLLKPQSTFIPKYYYYVVSYIVSSLIDNTKYERHNKYFQNLFVPRPPKETQLKIVANIEILEKKEAEAKEKIEEINSKIDVLLSNVAGGEGTLNKIAPYVDETVKIEEISLDTYVTTDNMLQNKLGIIPFIGTPNITSVTKYKEDDILMSNIRPYLKKIWLADREGGCSKDVLAFRISDKSLYLPKFIYYMMRRDIFFDYVMEGKKGVKMPRGNKEEIMKYKTLIPSIKEQQKIVSEIEALEREIAKAQEIIDRIPKQQEEILKKYL